PGGRRCARTRDRPSPGVEGRPRPPQEPVMAYRLHPFADVRLTPAMLELLITEHDRITRPRLERLWRWYRNPAEITARAAGQPHARWRLAQEDGLPARFRGHHDPNADDRATAGRDPVIENDIAWRIQAMVDFMFGKPVAILSTAPAESARRRIERVLDAVWEASGGIALLQDIALLGHVYGHVDLLLRIDEGAVLAASRKRPTPAGAPAAPTPTPQDDDAALAALAAEAVRGEGIEPTRGIPLQDPADYRRLHAYIIHFERDLNEVDRPALLSWRPGAGRRRRSCRTEILSASYRQVYDDGVLVEESLHP